MNVVCYQRGLRSVMNMINVVCYDRGI